MSSNDRRFRVLMHMICLVFLCMLTQVACATPDDVTKGADAANRAASGGAESSTGSKRVDFAAQYSNTGDNSLENWKVEAQRNTSATKSGDVYTGVTIAAGGGAAALQAAIAADPLVQSYKAEIDALAESPAESRPVERLDQLRIALAARLKEIGDAAARSSPNVTISGTTMTITAPSTIGAPPQPLTEIDAKTAGEVKSIIEAGKPKPPEPTSQPAQ